MDLLSTLNDAQQQAVTHGDGPLLIVAGVGTGKTTVITRRIAWLIAEKLARPAEILALTFTEKAAAEMEERVDLLVPYGYIEAQIGTFHAFCDRVLRENAILLGLSPDYQILTEAEQAIFFKEHLFELPLTRYRPLGNPLRHVRAILSLFSRAKDEDVGPERYAKFVEGLRADPGEDLTDEERGLLGEQASEQGELAEVYGAYQRLLLEKARVDFGDLITLTLRLFREHPTVLARYQDRFRYILVDEFQDTNYAQFELLKLLASHRNLTVCGDDDQSIYRFRGAAISNILGFQETYPDTETVVLTRNYRSTQAILDSAYRLIQFNNPDRLEVRSGISKRLQSSSGTGHPPRQMHFETLDDECDFVVETIASRHADEDRAYNQFAILVRSNAQATSFLRSLNMMRIPWRFSGSRGLYDQPEIRALIAFLRTLADPRDNLSIHCLASSFLYGIQGEDLAVATSIAQRRNMSLLDVLRNLVHGSEPSDLSMDTRERIDRLVTDLTEMLPLSTQERTGEVVYRYLGAQTGTIERLSNSQEPSDALRIQSLAKLFAVIERFGRIARYDRVPWFVDYLDALIEAGDNPPVGDATWDADAVQIMTIHQAKGLEFAIVFLVGLIAGRFPSANRRDPLPLPDGLVRDTTDIADAHVQEERRLFYVGMTRAKEDLYLTSAQDVGGKRLRKPSLFVSEALDLDASQLTPQTRSPLQQILRHRGSSPADVAASEELKLFDTGQEILSLSYRQIDDYLTCPLRYRYVHVLRTPIRRTHAMVYGSAIHQAIRLFNMNRHAGRTTTLANLQAVFRKHWKAEGFLTRQHEELRLQDGLDALRDFHDYETAHPATPTYVERRFSLTDGDVRLVGVFDRIDIAEDSGTIIDYKTSAVRTAEEAQKRTQKSLQLAIYALAYQRLFDAAPTRLELRFLTPQVLVGAIPSSDKVLRRATDAIEKAAKGIRAKQFPGTPSFGACTYCAFAGICPSRQG